MFQIGLLQLCEVLTFKSGSSCIQQRESLRSRSRQSHCPLAALKLGGNQKKVTACDSAQSGPHTHIFIFDHCWLKFGMVTSIYGALMHAIKF